MGKFAVFHDAEGDFFIGGTRRHIRINVFFRYLVYTNKIAVLWRGTSLTHREASRTGCGAILINPSAVPSGFAPS